MADTVAAPAISCAGEGLAPAALGPSEVGHEETQRLLGAVTDEHPASIAVVNRVVMLNLSLADGLAHRYVGRGVERDDLEQVARLALVKAAHRYRPRLGVSFVAYAAPTIMGEIKRYFRDSGWMVRPPRRLQELCLQLGATEASLEQRLHRPASVEELSFALGVTESQVRTARQAAASGVPVPLDAVVADDRPPPQAPWVDDPVAHLDDAWWLAWGLEELGPRERAILQLRFGESLTQADIAKRVGVSQIQVSRILRGILGRVRARLQSSLVAA